MQVRSCRIARAANLRDNLSCRDELPRRDVQGTAMGVARVSIVGGVINQNLIAVAVAQVVGDNNLPVEQCADIRAVFVTQINARMKFPIARNGMNSPAERRRYGQ